MSLHRHTASLLSVTSAVATDQIGSSFVVLPADGDRLNDKDQSFRAFFHATQEGGVTAPTTDVRLETSDDKTNWVSVVAATQQTQDGSVHEFKDITALGPFVRAVTQLGGGTKPDHTATVQLVSNGPFRLKAA